MNSIKLCLGESLNESRDCGTSNCTFWSEWSEWSLHPVDWKFIRDRKCQNIGQFSKTCPGPNNEEKFCTKTECPYLSEWTPWAQEGIELKRYRTCLNGIKGQPGCTQPNKEVKPCSGTCLNYGNWSLWEYDSIKDIYTRTRLCWDDISISKSNNICMLNLSKTETLNCSSNPQISSKSGIFDFIGKSDLTQNSSVCATWSTWNDWQDIQRNRLKN